MTPTITFKGLPDYQANRNFCYARISDNHLLNIDTIAMALKLPASFKQDIGAIYFCKDKPRADFQENLLSIITQVIILSPEQAEPLLAYNEPTLINAVSDLFLLFQFEARWHIGPEMKLGSSLLTLDDYHLPVVVGSKSPDSQINLLMLSPSLTEIFKSIEDELPGELLKIDTGSLFKVSNPNALSFDLDFSFYRALFHLYNPQKKRILTIHVSLYNDTTHVHIDLEHLNPKNRGSLKQKIDQQKSHFQLEQFFNTRGFKKMS